MNRIIESFLDNHIAEYELKVKRPDEYNAKIKGKLGDNVRKNDQSK